MTGRNWSIESLRGVAIFLMVSGHVIGGDSMRGMQVTDESFWRHSVTLLSDIRMPLFATLSGFIYSFRPVKDGTYRRMVSGKARRLLIPLTAVGVLYVAWRSLIPGVNNPIPLSDIWRLWAYSIGHFWFLQALFLIFLVVGALDLLDILNRKIGWIAATSVSVAVFVVVSVPSDYAYFAINGALRLLPFFLLGYGLNVYFTLFSKPVLLASLVAFLIFYAIRISTTFSGFNDFSAPVERLVQIGVGIAAVLLIFAIQDHIVSTPLAWIGQFAFPIYLLHVFGTAAARITISPILGIESNALTYTFGMLFGLGLPVLFTLTLGRIDLVSRVLLGQRARGHNRWSEVRKGIRTSHVSRYHTAYAPTNTTPIIGPDDGASDGTNDPNSRY